MANTGESLINVVTALEWSYLDGKTDVAPSRLKSAAELLVLRHDTLKLIDGAGPTTLAQDQTSAEEPGVNGKEPERQITDSGINLVECPRCGRMRSLSPSKGVLRFKAHTPRKQQTPLTEKRWSATGKTDWSVVEG